MNWIATLAAVLLAIACGLTGSLVFLLKARAVAQREGQYQVSLPPLRPLAAVLGALVGLGCAAILGYFFALNRLVSPVEWVGRLSYLLIAASAGGQLLVLVTAGLQMRREEQALAAKEGPDSNSLGATRLKRLAALKRQFRQYIDLKSRDDEVLDELLGPLGDPLGDGRRSLARIPYYGYLGTVCGILLVAFELSRINEATETFKVLSSMAEGLVLAFQTTLVALLAYLPLRKANDVLLQRLGRIEAAWLRQRTESVDER